MASRNWMPISTAPEGVEVETKIDDKDGCRNEQTLIRFGCCWFIPDKGIYVYYEPTHWRPMRKETGDTIEALQQRVGELERALQKVKEPFSLGTNEYQIDFDTLALEFNRRQRIASQALHQEPGKHDPRTGRCPTCGFQIRREERRPFAFEEEPSEGGGGDLEPHAYVPSAQHMGDCRVCGHLVDSPIHRTPPEPAQEGE